MCGILGEWRAGEIPDVQSRFAGGLARLAHRGPDDRGQYVDRRADGTLVLAHTRLSIIDLSSAGHQPMVSADGRYHLVFNGELYNYRELRAELRAGGVAFSGESDSEVLLAAWIRWGAAGLRRFIGMFAFVVYDRVGGTLTAVRDAFGIKPFFHATDGDGFLFASEMPAMLAIRRAPARLDRQRAHDYLLHGVQDAAPESFVAGVEHLPPAHLLRLELRPGARPVVERWWTPRIAETPVSFDTARDAVRELFLDNVKLHLRSDVRVGAALSGGIDSSALVCAMRHVEPQMPIDTFSFVADDPRLSEEKWIDLVNERVGARAHKVRVRASDLEADLPDLIRVQGEPFCTTSMYAQYRVFQAARAANVTVVLEGQGADELLGGYDGYPGQRMLSLLERGHLAELGRFAARWREWPGRGGSAWRALIGQLLPDALYRRGLAFAGVDTAPPWLDRDALRGEGASLRPVRVRRSPHGRGRRLAEVLSQSLAGTYLPSLLRYGDRNAMRFSVENRVPFLTIPFAELMLSMPEPYLVSPAGETKHLFRAAMRGIVPDEILDRRDKVGFETPMRSWLAGLAPTIRNMLAQSTRFPFLSPADMRDTLDATIADRGRADAQAWRMINLCWWAQMYEVD